MALTTGELWPGMGRRLGGTMRGYMAILTSCRYGIFTIFFLIKGPTSFISPILSSLCRLARTVHASASAFYSGDIYCKVN